MTQSSPTLATPSTPLQGVLLPYQQKWVADNSKVRMVEKSRRVGLSWATAAQSVLHAAKAGGADTWYIGYTKDMAIEFVRDCTFWARHFNEAVSQIEEGFFDEEKDVLTFSINFSSGKRITALSSSPRNLRGKQGHVIIDEAAFHSSLKELLQAAFALLIWGGTVSIISTHYGVDNPFNELVGDVRSGKKPYSLHRITFDEAVEQGLCKRSFLAQKRAWSEAAQVEWVKEIRAIYHPNDAEELDCVPAESGGAYLTRSLIESRMSEETPVLRFVCANEFTHMTDVARQLNTLDWLERHIKPLLDKLPPHVRRMSFGMDFGRSGDLSVIVPLMEGQQLQLSCPFVIEMRNVPFSQQEQLLFWLIDRLPRFNFGALDARGNGQSLAEKCMQRYGASSIEQVMLSQQWYLENMPRMKAALEDGTLVGLPKDDDILQDLRALEVFNGIPRLPLGKTKSGAQQRHGDSAIALALAIFSAKKDGGRIEYTPVPKLARDAVWGEVGNQPPGTTYLEDMPDNFGIGLHY